MFEWDTSVSLCVCAGDLDLFISVRGSVLFTGAVGEVGESSSSGKVGIVEVLAQVFRGGGGEEEAGGVMAAVLWDFSERDVLDLM